MMKRITLTALALSFVFLFAASAFAQEETINAHNLPAFSLKFNTFFIYMNDSDFDRSKPLYDEYGQSVGYVSTVLEPTMIWSPTDYLKVVYGAHIGENVWSRNDAETRDMNAANAQVFQQRDIYATVNFNGEIGLTTGYRQIADPTRLFFERYIGSLSLDFRNRLDNGFTVVAGQVPDTTYENTTADTGASELRMNNFENDIFISGIAGALQTSPQFGIMPGLFLLYDGSEIDREKTLINPCAHLTYAPTNWLSFYFDLALQFGAFKNAGLNNRDVEVLAGAAQLGYEYRHKMIHLLFNALYLSGDGDRNDNNENGYTYSGKSRGRTLLLTENWLQDQYDNLDERAAAQRAGLLTADFQFGVLPIDSLEVFLIFGAADATNTANLDDDDPNLGIEGDLGLTWKPFRNGVSFDLVGGGLWPGKSGAVLQNQIDMSATDPIYHGQARMSVLIF